MGGRGAGAGLGARLLPIGASARHNSGMGRKDKGREICINCGQTFHKKLTSKELRCTKCRKAEKKAA
jgi:ribosomal protein L37AE/L43A